MKFIDRKRFNSAYFNLVSSIFFSSCSFVTEFVLFLLRFKDGQYFEANERFQVIFNEEEDSLALMFQHVTPEDAGLYTCVASTSTGSKIACSAELTVQGIVGLLLFNYLVLS